MYTLMGTPDMKWRILQGGGIVLFTLDIIHVTYFPSPIEYKKYCRKR